jgi:Asp-tRNA(Asn)/Glu-tRNA(Gln) amidotransferase A subunit family amidase
MHVANGMPLCQRSEIGINTSDDADADREIGMSQPLHMLTASEAAARIARGEITSEALVRSCLERIEAREPDVGAWAFIDRDRAVAAARALDAVGSKGLLHGVPVGFKDIVETADLPTGFGSSIYHSYRPVADAPTVALTRAAGAVILGKTVTTEFAFRFPGKTSNPHNRRHSPGGSSSGSAAAVADAMVPLAVGTQTGGSIIRPAAYCGVYGLKPSYGQLSFAGVRHMAESLDTLGCMARSLDDIALFRSVLLGIPLRQPTEPGAALRIGLCRTPFWDEGAPCVRALLEETAGKLARAGARVVDFDFPEGGKVALEATWCITKFEGARAFVNDRTQHPESVSSAVRATTDEGLAIPIDAYLGAMRRIELMRARLDLAFADFDAILTPSAIDEAPLGLSDTGPITFNFLWTAAHTPAITLPVGRGPLGLPLAIQLVARRHDDERLLQVARWVAPRVDAGVLTPIGL